MIPIHSVDLNPRFNLQVQMNSFRDSTNTKEKKTMYMYIVRYSSSPCTFSSSSSASSPPSSTSASASTTLSFPLDE